MTKRLRITKKMIKRGLSLIELRLYLLQLAKTAGGKAALSQSLDLHPSVINGVISGRTNNPSPLLLQKLGLEEVQRFYPASALD